jgi:hypothetical protein
VQLRLATPRKDELDLLAALIACRERFIVGCIAKKEKRQTKVNLLGDESEEFSKYSIGRAGQLGHSPIKRYS